MNIVKFASIAGTALGIVGTLLSGWASQQTTKETIAKQVADALANQAKES